VIGDKRFLLRDEAGELAGRLVNSGKVRSNVVSGFGASVRKFDMTAVASGPRGHPIVKAAGLKAWT
jgi:hypothetical protein